MSDEGNHKTSIQVIERMMQLLDALAEYSDPVALKDLAKHTSLHPSTAHRILSDLVACRLVDRSDPGLYRLGMRLLELGNLVKARLNVRDAALEHMRTLHKTTEQTINLAVRQGDEIVYVERAFSERSGMQVVRAIGARGPLHLTSTGKLFLANDGLEALKNYAERTQLKGQTANSLTSLPALQAELQSVKQQGFARDKEELEMGVCCIAAGIYDDSSNLIAGLSISAPTDRFKEDWLKDLLDTVEKISVALGWRGKARPMKLMSLIK